VKIRIKISELVPDNLLSIHTVTEVPSGEAPDIEKTVQEVADKVRETLKELLNPAKITGKMIL
jgi:hypothetical protein